MPVDKFKYKSSLFVIEYRKYRAMITKHKVKGLAVCKEWLDSFDNFYEDMGDCPDGSELVIKDRDKPYCKENCAWASRQASQYSRKLKTKHLRGVTYRERFKKWVAQITIDYFPYYIGAFDTEQQAHEAYLEIAREWYGFNINQEELWILKK